MAIPVFIKFLPKLLPAAKLAYDHRDKAVTLYKNIRQWRSKDQSQEPLTIDINPALTPEQEIDELRSMIARHDDIITEQSEILAKLANDLSEISTLTDRLRRRSQWMWRGIYLALIIMLVRWMFY